MAKIINFKKWRTLKRKLKVIELLKKFGKYFEIRRK